MTLLENAIYNSQNAIEGYTIPTSMVSVHISIYFTQYLILLQIVAFEMCVVSQYLTVT